MKILHICTGFPLSFQGGITNYVRTIAQKQYENGYDVCVMAAADNQKYDFDYIAYSSRIKNFTYGKLEDKKALNCIKAFLEKEKFNLIHIHMVLGIDWDLYETLKPYHYIVSLHDYYYLCPRIYMVPKENQVCEKYDEEKCKKCISYFQRFGACRYGLRKLNQITHKNLSMPYTPQSITHIRYEKFKQLLEGADYLLPVSTRTDDIYKKSKIKTKSVVLHIGNISADNYTEKFEYNLEPHKIKIVFLGRLAYYKGADLFIKIAEHIDKTKYELHFYGRPENYIKQMEQNAIINHGTYKQTDLSSILADYDLGMVLSVWEDNGPQVVMELLNNHIPVIGTEMGGILDFVNNHNGFIFNPYSDKDFDELMKFFDGLTVEKIASLKKNIIPTKTTSEHYEDLMKVYNKVFAIK